MTKTQKKIAWGVGITAGVAAIVGITYALSKKSAEKMAEAPRDRELPPASPAPTEVRPTPSPGIDVSYAPAGQYQGATSTYQPIRATPAPQQGGGAMFEMT